ncbi:MAG: hypothetical protein HYZ75_19230 [Elusimicrobia bacterium]|nr:hypothetical protein [Elusimicrobiota bacterium]
MAMLAFLAGGMAQDALAAASQAPLPASESGKWEKVVDVDPVPEATKLAAEFDKAASEIRRESESKLDELRQATVAKLKAVQDKFTKEARLDEALAVRDRIWQALELKADPGLLRSGPQDIGKIWYFEVVGNRLSSVWGSGVYTTDSSLAAAAVHAGVVEPGKKAVIKVTILPGQAAYTASEKNGVRSLEWADWHTSFRLERTPF